MLLIPYKALLVSKLISCLAKHLDRFLNLKAVAANFTQEKTLVGTFSVIIQL